jgi:hypothetical protein
MMGNATAIIRGNVSEYKDINGPASAVPVTAACIYAYHSGGGMGHSATTDATGNWSISGLVDGETYNYYLQDSCTYVPNAPTRFDYINKYEYPNQQTTLVAKNSGSTPGAMLLKEISRTGAGSVSGRVKDADDYTNLPGVSVTISRANGGIVISPVVTDSRGEYSFPSLPAGDYYLQIGNFESQDETHYASWVSVEVGTDANRVNAFLTKVPSKTLSGVVSGKRSKVKEIILSNYIIQNALVSYPDKEYYDGLRISNGRNGSLGGLFLKRFNWFFDYKNNVVYFKKNKLYDQPFEYNMSGLEIQHKGSQWVKYEITAQDRKSNEVDKVINLYEKVVNYKYELKPIYEIYAVRENSPAFKAGLKEGDQVIKINGKKAINLKIDYFNDLFISDEGKQITIVVNRKGKYLTFKFAAAP